AGGGRSQSCRLRRRANGSSCARAGMPRINANGCVGFRGLLASTPIVRRTRSPMRSSKWHALGNIYLLVERAELTPDEVRAIVGDADGVVQVVRSDGESGDVVIWNPDGS